MSVHDHIARRAGRREANLRRLNERIADAQSEAGLVDAEILMLVCECALEDCDSHLMVPASAFDGYRDSTSVFAVVPGHVLHDVEEVIADGEGWMFVEKVGEAAAAANEELS